MGINRLLIDSRIQGGQGGMGGGHTPPNQGHQPAATVTALGGRSNDSMGGPSIPL